VNGGSDLESYWDVLGGAMKISRCAQSNGRPSAQAERMVPVSRTAASSIVRQVPLTLTNTYGGRRRTQQGRRPIRSHDRGLRDHFQYRTYDQRRTRPVQALVS
jgi:hypothetical protein